MHVNVRAFRPVQVRNNGSYFLHAFLSKKGMPINAFHPAFDRRSVVHRKVDLVYFLPKIIVKATQNLITGEVDEPGNETPADGVGAVSEGGSVGSVAAGERPISPYWHPNVTFSLVDDMGAINPTQVGSGRVYLSFLAPCLLWLRLARASLRLPCFSLVQLPPQFRHHIITDFTGDYYPVFFHNTFWNLRSGLLNINSTVKEVRRTLAPSCSPPAAVVVLNVPLAILGAAPFVRQV